MEISERLKQRFCKDMGVSIQIYKSPYFEDRLELMGYKKEYDSFIHFVTKEFQNEESYFAYYNELKDKIIDFIKNSESYQALQEDTSFCKKPDLNLKQGDTYKDSCVGRQFLSIDIKKANFSALVKYGKENGKEFFGSYDYEAFMKQFTPYDYFTKSKYIRQTVFGNCNPKKQIAYETFLMSDLLRVITENEGVTELSIKDTYSLNSDEIIFDITGKDKKIVVESVNDLIKKEGFDFPLKVERFVVGKLEGTKAYAKLFEDGTYELKCVNPYEAPFIYRYMKNQTPIKTDRYFMYEGRLAKFEDVPFIKLVTEAYQVRNVETEEEEKEMDL